MKATLVKGFRSSVVVYLATAASLLAAFFVSVILARGLPQTEFGVYRVLASVVLIGTFVASAGLEPALSRFGAELWAQRQTRLLQAWLRRFLGLRIGALLIGGISLWAFREDLAVALNLGREYQWSLGLAAVILGLVSVNSLWGTAFLSARLEQGKGAFAHACGQILLAAGYGALLYAGYGLGSVLAYWAVVQAVLLLAYTRMNAQWAVGQASERHADTAYSAPSFDRRIARYSFFQYFAMMAHFAADPAVNSLLIASLLTLEDVAIFGVAVTLALLVMRANPTSLLRSVVQTILVQRYVVTRSKAELDWSLTFLTKVTIVIIVPLNVALIAFAEPLIVQLFGPAYVAAAEPLIILAALMTIAGLSYPFTPLIGVLEKNEIYLVAGAISLLNPVLSILLISLAGISGAALAVGLTGAVRYVFYVVAFRWHLGFAARFPWGTFAKVAFVTGILAALGCSLRAELTTLPLLLGAIVGLGVAYIAGMAVLQLFDERERQLLRAMTASATTKGP